MSDEVRDTATRLPALLEEAALVNDVVSGATGGMSKNWWRNEVAAGRAPQAVIREVKCTRWRLMDVRAFWLERAARGSDPAVAERIRAQAERASAAARRLAEQAATE